MSTTADGIVTYCSSEYEKNKDIDLVNLCNSLYNYYAAIKSYCER